MATIFAILTAIFVSALIAGPDAQLLAATEQAIQDSVDRIRGMFGAMTNQSAAHATDAVSTSPALRPGGSCDELLH